MYRIKIVRLIENKNYEEDRQKAEASQRYGSPSLPYPQKYIEERSLETDLTDDEWETVKKQIIALT
jgi:hypothetical protein